MPPIEPRVVALMAAVLNVEPSRITPDASPETLEAWDSLAHMNLVVSLEEEFGVELGDDAVASLTSFGRIVTTLRSVLERAA